MNKKWHPSLILVIAAAFIVTGVGCASLNPDNFLPKSIAPAGNDQRIDGSVNVQAFVPESSEGKVQIEGEYVPPAKRGRVALFPSGKLRVALEKAIAQKGLFQRIEQGNADYVLDVWVENAIREIKYVGEGYIIDMTAIWRLTRARDGKVIFCDFANGHGASHAFGTSAYVQALETATREMIQKGLFVLSDRSTEHLAATYVAGNRPSMGNVVPEGIVQMIENIKKNWSKLSMSMTVDEVEKLLGPVTSGTAARVYTKGYTKEYSNNMYRLVFINGKLSLWELYK